MNISTRIKVLLYNPFQNKSFTLIAFTVTCSRRTPTTPDIWSGHCRDTSKRSKSQLVTAAAHIIEMVISLNLLKLLLLLPAGHLMLLIPMCRDIEYGEESFPATSRHVAGPIKQSHNNLLSIASPGSGFLHQVLQNYNWILGICRKITDFKVRNVKLTKTTRPVQWSAWCRLSYNCAISTRQTINFMIIEIAPIMALESANYCCNCSELIPPPPPLPFRLWEM